MTLNYHEIYLSVEQKYWSTVGRKKATKTFVHWTKERLLRYLCLIRQTGFRVHQKTYLIPHTHTKSKWAITDTLKMQQLKQMKVSSNERNRRHRNSAPRVRLRQSESCHKLCNDFFSLEADTACLECTEGPRFESPPRYNMLGTCTCMRLFSWLHLQCNCFEWLNIKAVACPATKKYKWLDCNHRHQDLDGLCGQF
jgi:hypothetical protein